MNATENGSRGPAGDTPPLRVLLLEDSNDDAALVEREFKRKMGRIAFKHVTDRETYLGALTSFFPDLILCDYTVPGFDGIAALKTAQEVCPHTPFLFVSGTIGEDRAIDAIRAGALDFVVKERLSELTARVQRAMREAADRQERVRLEEELRQAQKLEALGKLAGGIAHDFNNLLTVIGGFTERLLAGLPAENELRAEADEIRRAAEQASELTRQLVAFGRRQMLTPSVLDLNSIVRDTDRMLRRLIGEDIELELDLEERLGNVRSDSTQLGQVLMNLVINARDAMPKGGRIRIETRNETVKPATPGVAAEEFVVLKVGDTGRGMDPETRSRIFDPFFTTKRRGKGMGLGLSTVYGIVRQSGGSIAVYTKPGEGSIFDIKFPRVDESVPGAGEEREGSEARAGSETVLVVDDADSVRRLMEVILRQAGYTVLSARDGEEALRIGERTREAIHLLITDVVMPRMGGRDLVSRMQPTRASMRVLYTSGYSDDDLVGPGRLEAGTSYLQKPFTASDLLRKVRGVLDASAPVKA